MQVNESCIFQQRAKVRNKINNYNYVNCTQWKISVNLIRFINKSFIFDASNFMLSLATMNADH